MTIFKEIVQALSEREVELAAALELGFNVQERLEKIRALLQKLRDICAFAEAAQAADRAAHAFAPWRAHMN